MARTFFLLLTALVAGVTRAAELEVAVNDAEGMPVQDAVVILAARHAVAPRMRQHVVDQQGKQFRPWVLSITAGDEVRFTNHDDITHHVYSFSPARRFSFRLQSGEEEPDLVFDMPGVVVLGCNIHDWMVGYVHVNDGSPSAGTDENGIARFTGLAAGEWQARLWHPGLDANASPPPQSVTLENTHRLEFRLSEPLVETGPREPLDDSGYALP